MPKDLEFDQQSQMAPEVQVVIAVHRLDRPIRRAVNSVLECQDAEAIVVAHGIEPADLDLPDSDRITVLSCQEKMGYPGPPKNLGIAHATAPYVSLLDSDDYYEPGALTAMLSRARTEDADIVLAPTVDPKDGLQLSPLTTRQTGLSGARDRLYYRTAVRGLYRRRILQSDRYRLREDLRTGEDMQPTLRMFSDDLNICSFLEDPAYVLADDGGPRVSEAPMPASRALLAIQTLIEDGEISALPQQKQIAVIVKLLRIHVLHAFEGRAAQGRLSQPDLDSIARVVRALYKLNPDAVDAFSQADSDVLAGFASADMALLKQAISARETCSVRGRVLPTKLRNAFHRDGNLRNTVAGKRLAGSHRPFPAEQDSKPKLLIISYSRIASDARVLKQIELFKDDFAITACGYGRAPEGVSEYLEIPPSHANVDLYGRYITLKQYRLAYWRVDATKKAWELLQPRTGGFAAILANEIEALPLALRLNATHGVLADLHEYYPSLHEESEAWDRRIRPYYEWLCRRYLPLAAASTTVAQGIARKYETLTGVLPSVVTNATPYVDISPTPVHTPLRLVHHGAALRNRELHELVKAVNSAEDHVEMDMYLMPNDPAYIEELRQQAAGTRVRVFDGIAYEQLIDTLNSYDVGFYVLPPVSANHVYALPNKFFDFIQARLALTIGPSKEMSRIVEQYGLGVVTENFSTEAAIRALNDLTPENVAYWKNNSNKSALALSSQEQVKVWARLMTAMVNSNK